MIREEAINELNEELMGINPNALGREEIERWAVALDMAIKALEEERPHGEWIPSAPKGLVQVWYQRYKCSLCKKFGWIDWNFCPNCGAQMLEEPKTDEKEGEAE